MHLHRYVNVPAHVLHIPAQTYSHTVFACAVTEEQNVCFLHNDSVRMIIIARNEQ